MKRRRKKLVIPKPSECRSIQPLEKYPNRETALVHYLSAGLRFDDAVSKAGFDKIPANFLNQPDIQRLIETEWKGRLKSDLARCRAILMGFVEEERLPASTRIDAAKTLYSWLGKEPESAGKDKNPSEMSGDELRAAVSKLHRELGVRAVGAKVIDADNAPMIEGKAQESIDILG